MQLTIALGDDLPITVVQGASFARILRCQKNGIRISLSGYSGRGQVRASKKMTADLLMEFDVTVSQESDVDNVDCGKILWVAGAVATAEMLKKGYYNIELFNPSNLEDVVRIVQGPAALDPDVTADD